LSADLKTRFFNRKILSADPTPCPTAKPYRPGCAPCPQPSLIDPPLLLAPSQASQTRLCSLPPAKPYRSGSAPCPTAKPYRSGAAPSPQPSLTDPALLLAPQPSLLDPPLRPPTIPAAFTPMVEGSNRL